MNLSNKLKQAASHEWIKQSDRVYGECLFIGKRVPVMRTLAGGKKVVDYFDPDADALKIEAMSKRLSFSSKRTSISGIVKNN